jgi:ABC-type microcin C transport system permease subunit YejB
MSSMQTPVEYQTQTTPPQKRKEWISKTYVVLGVLAVLLLAGLSIWLIIWLAVTQGPTLEAVRDILIIALALESCLFGIVLLILLVMVVRLVNMLEFEIKPILQKTNETLGTVRGTTNFVSENVVKPVTKASSYAAGVQRGLATLFGNPRKNLRD